MPFAVGEVARLSDLETQYVNTTGDTMTGALTISNGAGVTSLSASGNVVVTGTVSGTHSGNGASLTSLTGANVTGTVGSATNATNVGANGVNATQSSVAVTFSTVSATSFTASSLKKLKENISNFDLKALDLLSSVKVVNFNYISDKDKNNYVGFIADDTTEILSTKTKDKMDITSSIGVLIKAVQELNQEIIYLKQPWYKKLFHKKEK